MRLPLPAVRMLDRVRRWRHGVAIYRRTTQPVEITLDMPGLGLFAHFNVVAGFAMRLRRRGRPFRVRCVTSNYVSAERPEWFTGLVRDLAPIPTGGPVQAVFIRRHAQVPNRWAGEVLTLEGAREAFFAKFAVEARWEEQARAFAARHFRAGETLGLHYRGTDKQSEAPRVDYDTVLARVRQALGAGGYSRLFVATDETALLEFLGPRLGVPLVTQPELIRSSTADAVHLRADHALGFKKATDALTDCLLLARCDRLVKTASALSGWSALINPELPIDYLNTPHAHGRFFPDSVLLDRQAAREKAAAAAR